jgi:transposase InsO family protein
MKFRFINDHKEQWPVRTLCHVLGVSPAGFYAWRSRPDSARAVANRELLGHVRRLYAQHRGRYGSPRLHAALRAEGRGVSRGRVERLMRQHGIRATASQRFRPVTTDSRHGLPVAPNLLEQRFVASAPTRSGWLTSPTFPQVKAGSIWQLSLIWRPGKWWAGRCVITCARN